MCLPSLPPFLFHLVHRASSNGFHAFFPAEFIASCKAGGADLKSQSVADAQKNNGASHAKPALVGAALAMSALYLFN